MYPLQATGLAAVGVGGATALGGLIYRNSVHNDAERVPQYEQAVQARSAALNDAASAVEDARPAHPGDISADEAVAIAEQRYGRGVLLTAETGHGDSEAVSAADVIDKPSRSLNSAAATAASEAGGRGTSVVRVGDWFVPVVLDDALAPEAHSRKVSYRDTEYGYDYGYNYQTGDYDYHYGPHSVTRWRTERFLSEYDRFTPEQFNVAKARSGGSDGNDMRNLGTVVEQSANAAEHALNEAQGKLDHGQRSAEKADGAGRIPLVIGGAAATVGAGLIAAPLILRAVRR